MAGRRKTYVFLGCCVGAFLALRAVTAPIALLPTFLIVVAAGGAVGLVLGLLLEQWRDRNEP